MEDSVMRTATETREDDNIGALKMWNIGNERQGQRWRGMADNRGYGDAGQQVQQQHKYRNMNTA